MASFDVACDRTIGILGSGARALNLGISYFYVMGGLTREVFSCEIDNLGRAGMQVRR